MLFRSVSQSRYDEMVVGVGLLVKMFGVCDLVFLWLLVLGYWCYLFGGLIFCVSLLLGIVLKVGWFMYMLLFSVVYMFGLNLDFWLIGIIFVEILVVLVGVELVVLILCICVEGMLLNKMLIYVWYILVKAIVTGKQIGRASCRERV